MALTPFIALYSAGICGRSLPSLVADHWSSSPIDHIHPNPNNLQDGLTEELEPNELNQRPTYCDDEDRLCKRDEVDAHEDKNEFCKMGEEEVYNDEDELPKMGEEDVHNDTDEFCERDKEDAYDIDPVNWPTIYDSKEELDP